MNILFLDQFSEMGGAQQCLLELLPAINEQGWQAHVAAFGNGPLLQNARAFDMRAHTLPGFGSEREPNGTRNRIALAFSMPRAAAVLSRLVQEFAIDVVYVNGPRILPAVVLIDRPVIFHAHSIVRSKWAQNLEVAALRWTRAEVIAVSQYAATPLRRSLPEERIHVIQNGVPAFGLRRAGRSGPRRVGIVGRIAPEKGQLDFIRAARMIARSRGDVRFLICGAPLFASRAYADHVEAEARLGPVELMGWQSDVRSVLASLDILVVPSAPGDAAPRIIIEAFSAGIPVVAYPSGGIPELIEPGAGVLTKEGNVPSLVEAVVSLLGDPERMHTLSVNGRRLWERRFRVERYRKDIAGVLAQYDPALEGRPGMRDPRKWPGRQRLRALPHTRTTAH